MNNISTTSIALIIFLTFTHATVSANECEEETKQEKINCFNEAKKCVQDETRNLNEEMQDKDLSPAKKEILAKKIENCKGIIAAADAGISAANSGDKKALQAEEDKLNGLRESNHILGIKWETMCVTHCLKDSAGSDAALSALSGEIEKAYTNLLAKEEAAIASRKQAEEARRQVEALRRKFRIAELNREKKQLESE